MYCSTCLNWACQKSGTSFFMFKIQNLIIYPPTCFLWFVAWKMSVRWGSAGPSVGVQNLQWLLGYYLNTQYKMEYKFVVLNCTLHQEHTWGSGGITVPHIINLCTTWRSLYPFWMHGIGSKVQWQRKSLSFSGISLLVIKPIARICMKYGGSKVTEWKWKLGTQTGYIYGITGEESLF
jgi:hypothetical protein